MSVIFLLIYLLIANIFIQANTNGDNDNICVQQIIAIDDSLSNIRNNAAKEISLSTAINNYIEKMYQEDYRDCPDEFTKAFHAHLMSWEKMLVLTDKYPEVRGEMHEVFDKIAKGEDSAQYNLRLKDIWDTWAEVEKAIKE